MALPTLLPNPSDIDRVAAAITEAERGSLGEVRVQLDACCDGEPLDRARACFFALGMDRTAHGTGVLLYAAVESRKAAVWAGEGLHAAAAPGFWDTVLDALVEGEAKAGLAEGLVSALTRIGALLRERFPGEDSAGNELPDDVGSA
jgi:uncharacterized membrane protein